MKKDVITYFFSKVIIGFTGIIILKLYSSMIDPTGYGEYSLITSLVTALVSIFIGWIGSSALRYYDEYKNKKIEFFSNITAYYLLMLIICYIILIICSLLMTNINIIKYFLSVIYFVMMLSANEILEKVLRASNKTTVYAIASIIQSILSVTIFYVLAKIYNFGVESIFISNNIAKTIFAIISLISIGYVISFRKFRINKQLLKKFLSYGIPMIGVWGVGWILHYCDRYIISIFINNYEVGIYDMSCKISENTINLFISSFTLAIFPVMIRDWNLGGVKIIEDKLKTIIKYYNLIIMPAIVGLILIVDKLYLGIIDSQYSTGKLVIIIICIGSYVSGLNSILNKIWQLNEKTKNILYILIMSVILNIALNIIFIPIYGINAAAMTTFASYFFSLIITYIFVKKEMKIFIDLSSLFKTIFSCICMGIFIIFFNKLANNMLLVDIEIFISCIIYGVINILTKNIDLKQINLFIERRKK